MINRVIESTARTLGTRGQEAAKHLLNVAAMCCYEVPPGCAYARGKLYDDCIATGRHDTELLGVEVHAMRLTLFYQPVQTGLGYATPGPVTHGRVQRFFDWTWMKRRVVTLHKVPEELWNDRTGILQYIESKGILVSRRRELL